MSRKDKLIARMCAKPTPADFTWRELRTVLGGLGYKLLKGQGSRRKFFNRDRDLLVSCHEPHPRKLVGKGCLEDIVAHLLANGVIEEMSNGTS